MQDQTRQRVNSTLRNGSRGKHANTLASVNGGAQPLCRSAKRPMEGEAEGSCLGHMTSVTQPGAEQRG
jgi:hypothetical protein